MKSLSLFRCLADPTRLAVLQQLAEGGDLHVADFVELTGKEQTNVSHHLAQLRACGLVTAERDGKRVRYTLAHPKLKAFVEEAERLAEHIECADADACSEAGCC